jgi:hypothetical protein
VELPTDDEIKAGLHTAFFDQVATWLHWAEFAIAAEDIAILITEGFHDAKGWDLGSGEVCAHVLWGNMKFLGDGTVNGKPTDKLFPKMIFSAVGKGG